MIADGTEELFDVLSPVGKPTGEVKPRSAVHRDGDWHRAFHCWLVWRGGDGAARLLLQRRGPDKDTYPGYVDVAVGGHLSAGETVADAAREVDEEMGLTVDLGDLVWLGTRRVERIAPGWVDREFQEVYVDLLGNALPDLHPAPEETIAVYDVAADALVSLFDGRASAITARCAVVRQDRTLGPWWETGLSAADFIPVADNYWAKAAEAATRLLRGEGEVRVDLP